MQDLAPAARRRELAMKTGTDVTSQVIHPCGSSPWITIRSATYSSPSSSVSRIGSSQPGRASQHRP